MILIDEVYGRLETDDLDNARGRFDRAIKSRLEKDPEAPVLIIFSRLHEEDHPGGISYTEGLAKLVEIVQTSDDHYPDAFALMFAVFEEQRQAGETVAMSLAIAKGALVNADIDIPFDPAAPGADHTATFAPCRLHDADEPGHLSVPEGAYEHIVLPAIDVDASLNMGLDNLILPKEGT